MMDRDLPTVEAHLSLQDFVDEYLPRSGRRWNDQVAGLITPHEVRTVDRERRSRTSVQIVMRPLSQLRFVAPDIPALRALELMSREDINQLPVISDGRLEGVFSRGHVLQLLRTHAELHSREALPYCLWASA